MYEDKARIVVNTVGGMATGCKCETRLVITGASWHLKLVYFVCAFSYVATVITVSAHHN